MKTQTIDFILSGLLLTLLVCLSLLTVAYANHSTQALLGDYYVLFNLFFFLFLYGFYSIVAIRVMLKVKPFKEGTYLMTDNTFTYWKLFTVICEFGKGALLPFTTLFTRPLIVSLFGAKIGKNIALGGQLVDQQMITIGDEVIVGQDSVITAHTINSGSITLSPIVIADRATIGVHVVLMSGVKVGECAVIAAGSVVPPNTQISPNELWGGIPAKKIKDL